MYKCQKIIFPLLGHLLHGLHGYLAPHPHLFGCSSQGMCWIEPPAWTKLDLPCEAAPWFSPVSHQSGQHHRHVSVQNRPLQHQQHQQALVGSWGRWKPLRDTQGPLPWGPADWQYRLRRGFGTLRTVSRSSEVLRTIQPWAGLALLEWQGSRPRAQRGDYWPPSPLQVALGHPDRLSFRVMADCEVMPGKGNL